MVKGIDNLTSTDYVHSGKRFAKSYAPISNIQRTMIPSMENLPSSPSLKLSDRQLRSVKV
jgi:hypothetical protein